jgi:hypothetical protein
MFQRLRHQPKLHSIVLVCAVLLFAAQTLAVAHVHAGEAACAVCGHTDNPLAAEVKSPLAPPFGEATAKTRLSGRDRPERPLLRNFDPRGPPESVL